MRRSPHRSVPALAALILLLAACAAPPAASPSVSEPETPEASASASIGAAPSATPPGSPAASNIPEPVAWSQLGATGPAAREDHTWTVDPDAGIAYLFGGRDGSTAFDDTWAYDLANDAWTQLAPAGSPEARFGHEAAWVEGVGVVIFAGQAGSTFFGDLWAYDPDAGAWTELPATGATPTPRYGSCAGIGPDGRLWISHGFTSDGTRFSDTRAYDFETAAWTDATPSGGSRPVERCLHGCWWTDAGELALYAGQTTGTLALDDRWRLADGAWEQVEGSLPMGRNLYARARIDGATLIFGGQAIDGSYVDDLWAFADDSDDASQVELVGDGPQPVGRAGAELIFDEGRGRALLFGGRTGDGALGDLWALSGL